MFLSFFNKSAFNLLGDSRGQLYLLYMPVNPFVQNSKQDSMHVHEKLDSSKDENDINGENKDENKNVNGNANGEEKAKVKGDENEEDEKQDQFILKMGKENVPWNPSHYLSLIFKYVYGRSDINTKFETLPTTRTAGTMDLLDSSLEEQGRINEKKDLHLS